ncbi:MAG: histone deacetylase [Sandaracinaceae bacterium]|nr:histone deacetylase [Sandaracinaceae bacterium]
MTPAELPFALLDDPSFDDHRARGPHPERPERLEAARAGARAALEGASVLALAAREASRRALRAVHDEGYLDALEAALAEGWGQLDEDTFCSPGSRLAALRAAGGAAQLAEALVAGEARRGLALVRPPGHHAEADRAMGFCLLNNVAVAAEAARAAGAERVAIVDWDVHHGNGTQHVFEARDDVLFISLHQWPLYPGTGRASEVGRGPGEGRTVNLALPSGSGDEVYAEAFRRVVLPALRAHAPDLVLVSAGFDAHARDPLASMHLSSAAYAAMASAIVEVADELGHGRVGFFLEGGYDLYALEESVAATVRAARGAHTELPAEGARGPAREAIDATLACVRAAWPAAFTR